MRTDQRNKPLEGIRQTLAGLGFEAAAMRLSIVLKYNPRWREQPRVPRGSREGGRWTDSGGVQIAAAQVLLPILQRAAPAAQRLYEVGKRVAPNLRRVPKRWDLLDDIIVDQEFDNETRRVGPISPRRPGHEHLRFRTEKELKDFLGPAGRNYHWHHIVEKWLARDGIFPPEVIHSTDNIIGIPDDVHYCITGKMRSYYKDTGFITRKVVGTWAFADQFNFGIDLIERCFSINGYVPTGDSYTDYEKR